MNALLTLFYNSLKSCSILPQRCNVRISTYVCSIRLPRLPRPHKPPSATIIKKYFIEKVFDNTDAVRHKKNGKKIPVGWKYYKLEPYQNEDNDDVIEDSLGEDDI